MNLSAVFFLPHQPPLADFQDVRKRVYGNDCLPDEINQLYLITCLLIYCEAEPVARLCLYDNSAIGEKTTLLFGNIDFINNDLVFEKLIAEAEQYAYQNGYKTLLGPVNGSTWDEYRLPLTNEGRQFITDLPQPLYYATNLQQNGFDLIQRYYTQQSKLVPQEIDKQLEQKFVQENICIRSINLNDFENELHRLYPFCIKTFSQNIYYSPVDEADFIAKYKQIQSYLKAEFILIAENAAQQIVAFLLCLPDVYHSNTMVMKTMARSNEHQLQGLMTHMINLFLNRAVAAGYTWLLHAFFHEKNRSGKLSGIYNGQPFKSYALFQKKLSN